MTAGPAPVRTKAIVVPSAERTEPSGGVGIDTSSPFATTLPIDRPGRRRVRDHRDMQPTAAAAPDPAAVLDAFGIHGRAVEMVEVSGAWSNRVYRLTTGQSRFAVKEILNPWGDAGWRDWLEVAWRFELQAYAAG